MAVAAVVATAIRSAGGILRHVARIVFVGYQHDKTVGLGFGILDIV